MQCLDNVSCCFNEYSKSFPLGSPVSRNNVRVMNQILNQKAALLKILHLINRS